MIPIIKPTLDEAEAEAARRVILSGWVTQGPEVAAFESEFATFTGASHATAVSNCTTALHLALLVAGVKPGDEVVTVSHSYIATANAVAYCGATPIFVDIDPATYNIDPALIEQALSARTSAILVVHQMGLPCDMAAVAGIAKAKGLPLIEDAACASGSELLWDDQWEKIGKVHGDVACFSFHPRKILSTGDGGMLTTKHAAWDAKFKMLRQHGMSVPDTVRHGSAQVIFETHPVLGYNYRMTDIQAAVGREQLKRLPGIVARRRVLASRYVELLGDAQWLGLVREPSYARTNWQSFCVRLPDAADQRAVMQAMLDAGVATRRGIMCAHREDFYASQPLCMPLPESEAAQDHTIVLPLYPQMTDEDQQKVASNLIEATRL
ncbi:DegT/DnrJ/EryC1/StrS family aminotransferase [Novosphingobium album (ex Hu et al. 2023)]|uniref:DegT/DnrJ/EryC1/StrS family aminotransferase n=1 Tax=Novosphingobium album (ex Hu et al. 2023) TaxID=2930093 RepID=A0ABT0B424_9SPHN|nr:DegT/DnrJ/EryC1/StrS family aminotransferase [Novosphingobium album (ex Hu et al. 2023)]MCJ2179794.1 DegT/DnrJ/EryC1/StrS family aminotransferase [Novosphingobium album (ex Hu et al. 2023)]